ncbi:hypothetical protein MKEN_01131900 [Mycena kentingensis (nom. inval.)]|nr:hypothetical protein MKEN_01131900 [Mycena kentingensis (nom. inval.)]
MASAYSTHVLKSFEDNSHLKPPPTLLTDGLLSFDTRMHGNGVNMFSTQQALAMHEPSASQMSSISSALSESVFDRVNRLQAKLNQKLGPEFVSQRPGHGGGPKLTYAEGWKIINVANEVFGYQGWSSSIVSMTTDYCDLTEQKKYNVGVSVVMRVTLQEGAYHEDVGYGSMENSKSKGAALDKCKKEAVTDALKRALRNFGNVMGNCLYDKQYTQEIVKIKVPPVKLDRDNLYRIPAFSQTPSVAAGVGPIHTSPPAQPQPPQQPQPPKWQPQAKPEPPKPAPPLAASRPVQSKPVPPPAAPAPERKVSFAGQQPAQVKKESPPPAPAPAPQAAEDEYDEYGFVDDMDDAFLSTVDLGEGDMGQPIDFEEGLSGGCALEDAEAAEAQQQAAPIPVASKNEERYGPMGLGRTGVGQASRAPATVPQGQRGNMGPPANVARPGTSAGPNNGGAQQQRPVSAWPPPAAPNSGTGRISTSASSSASSSASIPPPALAPTRTRPPSVGGFNFPPGMEDTLLNQNRNPNQPPPPNHHGVKRNAETMMNGSRVGMGLSASTGSRQPLGTISMDPHAQTGDAKRLRR